MLLESEFTILSHERITDNELYYVLYYLNLKIQFAFSAWKYQRNNISRETLSKFRNFAENFNLK